MQNLPCGKLRMIHGTRVTHYASTGAQRVGLPAGAPQAEGVVERVYFKQTGTGKSIFAVRNNLALPADAARLESALPVTRSDDRPWSRARRGACWPVGSSFLLCNYSVFGHSYRWRLAVGNNMLFASLFASLSA